MVFNCFKSGQISNTEKRTRVSRNMQAFFGTYKNKIATVEFVGDSLKMKSNENEIFCSNRFYFLF